MPPEILLVVNMTVGFFLDFFAGFLRVFTDAGHGVAGGAAEYEGGKQYGGKDFLDVRIHVDSSIGCTGPIAVIDRY